MPSIEVLKNISYNFARKKFNKIERKIKSVFLSIFKRKISIKNC